jgi:hypothetical protein
MLNPLKHQKKFHIKLKLIFKQPMLSIKNFSQENFIN